MCSVHLQANCSSRLYTCHCVQLEFTVNIETDHVSTIERLSSLCAFMSQEQSFIQRYDYVVILS